jgi:hypothetical protein
MRKKIKFTVEQAMKGQGGSRGIINYLKIWSRDIVIGTVTRLRNEHPRNCGSIPGRGKRFGSSRKWPDPSLGFNHPPIQWEPEAHSPG